MVLSAELLTILIKARASSVLLLLLQYPTSIEIKGQILDPLGILGKFLFFD